MLAMPDEQTQQQLLDLTVAVQDDYGRVDLSSMWRPYSRYLLTTWLLLLLSSLLVLSSL